MDLFIKDNSMKIFSKELFDFIQNVLAGVYEVKYSEDESSIYIGYKTFYIYIFTDGEIDYSDLAKEYGIDINIDVIINIYNRFYVKALEDIAEIINWLAKRNNEDFMLLDDQSVQILCRKEGKVYFSKKGLEFPYHIIQLKACDPIEKDDYRLRGED